MAGDDINVIFGAMYNENMTDSCTITVIATGLDQNTSNTAMGKLGSNFSVTPKNIQTPISRPKPQAPMSGVNVIQASNGGQANTPVRPLTGIKQPADIRSNVKEQSLKIPDFLKR